MLIVRKEGLCGLEGCRCDLRRPEVFTLEYVMEDPERAAALLNHAYYSQVENEKQTEKPK